MSASKTKPKVTLRPATEQDSVAITNVVIRAFPADPQWYYRLPHWKEYPEDHFKYSEERIRGYQSQVALGRATYFVAEVDEDGSKKIVGLAMYQMPGTHLKGPNGKLCTSCMLQATFVYALMLNNFLRKRNLEDYISRPKAHALPLFHT